MKQRSWLPLRTFPLHFQDGPTIHFASHDERIAQMWAASLSEPPILCWFNNPADPGKITNENMKRENFRHLRLELFDRVCELLKNNVHPIRGMVARPEPLETTSIDEAVATLLERSAAAVSLLERMGCEKDTRTLELIESIADVREWMDGIAEEHASPSQRGWVGCDGRP